MRRRRKSSIARTLTGTFFIILGIVVCTATSIAGVDAYCRSDINKWLPIYPNAELVETSESGFFRPRASGITEQVYYTEDTPVEVRRWYREYRRDITDDMAAQGDIALSGIATTNYQISEDPNSEGTIIFQYAECAYS